MVVGAGAMITGFVLTVANGGEFFEWWIAVISLVWGLALLPSALSRIMARRTQLTVQVPPRHATETDVVSLGETSRRPSWVLCLLVTLAAVVQMTMLVFVLGKPGEPIAWFLFGWSVYLLTNWSYRADERWRAFVAQPRDHRLAVLRRPWRLVSLESIITSLAALGAASLFVRHNDWFWIMVAGMWSVVFVCLIVHVVDARREARQDRS